MGEEGFLKIVYIIDDDITILNLLIMAFKSFIDNSTVITETHGLRGLNLIKTGNPDLIILDIKLPGMNGLRICKELRAIEKFKHIPIIAFSGVDFDNYEKKFYNAGFNDYIPKSIELTELIKRIKKYLFEKQDIC